MLAVSSTFPLVNRHIHDIISQNDSQAYRVSWLIARLASNGVKLSTKSTGKIVPFLNAALQFPLCNQEILAVLEERCRESLRPVVLKNIRKSRREAEKAKTRASAPSPSTPASSDSDVSTPVSAKDVDLQVAALLDITLRFSKLEIPKRLFRHLVAIANEPRSKSKQALRTTANVFDNVDLPYIMYLLTRLHASADSHKGYPLARAVLARRLDLIRLLLQYGADPSIRDNMSVMLAIGRNDLEVVKLLIEPEVQKLPEYGIGAIAELDGLGELSPFSPSGINSRKRKLAAQHTSRKKQKCPDRIPVTPAMLEAAVKQNHEPLISYFMSKGEFYGACTGL